MPAATLDETAHRRLGVALFNRSWELLELPLRTADEDEELLHAVHAACFHWTAVGGPRQRRIGENQCARVYATVRLPDSALHHARRCLELVQAAADDVEQSDLEDWELASALEVLARAHLAAGDRVEAERCAARAREALATVSDQEDAELVAGQLADLELLLLQPGLPPGSGRPA